MASQVEQVLLEPLLDDRAGSCIEAGVRCTCVKTERFQFSLNPSTLTHRGILEQRLLRPVNLSLASEKCSEMA